MAIRQQSLSSLKGSIVALVTPFKDGKVDEGKIEELVAWQIENGTAGIVACGTTGEAPTLTEGEYRQVVRRIVSSANGRVPIIAGTGDYSTSKTVERTSVAESLGVDGALVVSPYFNTPTQAGNFEHFSAVARSTALPIILYNIKSRTGVNVDTDTIARLSEAFDNIIGVKESSGSIEQMTSVICACGEDFNVYSGDDTLALPCVAIGGSGVVSTVANLVPQDVASMIYHALSGNWSKARWLNERLFPLIRACFVETNPIPIKRAMSKVGLIDGEIRLPLVPLSPIGDVVLSKAMSKYGLVKSAQ